MHEEVFLSLVRAGLWEGDVNDSGYGLAVNGSDSSFFGEKDWVEVTRLADEQNVVGLVAAGFEQLTAFSLPITVKLPLLGKCQLIEQRNMAMNHFVAGLMAKMREAGINALLLKGQGLAQCYERPMWRSCGDIDLFLDDDNYERAKRFLKPIASRVDKEAPYSRHLAMIIDSWTVELHGYLRCGLSKRIDRELDAIRNDLFSSDKLRTWMNGKVPVCLPNANSDVVYVFTHILNHFYKGGVGLRQICDWCRLLWINKECLDAVELEMRLREMWLVTEWKAFGAFAVHFLAMPKEAMPLFDESICWRNKAEKIFVFVMEVGNMGHNRDFSYFERLPYVIRKTYSLSRRCGDLTRHIAIFPISSISFFPRIIMNGILAASRGE